MVTNQSRSNRKPSGARYKRLIVRRQHQAGGTPALTKIGAERKRSVRTIGGNQKNQLLASQTATVVGKDGKHVQATIISVTENAANRHFVRRNILTKGSILETDKGLAKVTNRPGQDGVIHAVLQ